MAPPFLPQARPQVPGNADVSNALMQIGGSIGGALGARRDRNQLAELGQAAQGGDLNALRDTAFEQGRVGLGLQAQGTLDTRESRAQAQGVRERQLGLQERRVAIAEEGLKIKQDATERDRKIADHFIGQLTQDKGQGKSIGDTVGRADAPSAVKQAAMVAFATGDLVEGAKILAEAEENAPERQRQVAAAKERGKVEGKRAGELPELFNKAQANNAQIAEERRVVTQDIDRAVEIATNSPATGPFSLTNAIPGTPAANLRFILDSIKANIGFDKLQAMREASPTGGALGQVSNLEIGLLQSVLGSLEQAQTQEQFLFNMTRLKDVLGRMDSARQEAFRNDFGDLMQDDPAPQRRRYNPETGQIE